jgi:hypothetical protein
MFLLVSDMKRTPPGRTLAMRCSLVASSVWSVVLRRCAPAVVALAVGLASSCNDRTRQTSTSTTVTWPSSARSPAASSTVATAGAAADVCALLSPDDVAASLGEPVRSVQPAAGSGWIVAQCTWTSTNLSASLALGTAASFAARGVTAPISDWVAQRRDSDAKILTVADITGVGEGGYEIIGRSPVAIVYGGRGSVLVQVIVAPRTGAVDAAVPRTLAKKALATATR